MTERTLSVMVLNTCLLFGIMWSMCAYGAISGHENTNIGTQQPTNAIATALEHLRCELTQGHQGDIVLESVIDPSSQQYAVWIDRAIVGIAILGLFSWIRQLRPVHIAYHHRNTVL
jgi:hypothetical protein